MLRVVVGAVVASWLALLPAQAAAQVPVVMARADVGDTVAAFGSPASLETRELDQAPLELPRFVAPPMARPSRLLSSLLVSTVVMQALDVHSTYRALGQGAVEANPVMAGLAGNTAAFVATKAAVASATVLAARHMGKRHKVAAIVTLVAINSAYAAVIDHNYRVARRLR